MSSIWRSEDDVAAFAGDDWNRAVIPARIDPTGLAETAIRPLESVQLIQERRVLGAPVGGFSTGRSRHESDESNTGDRQMNIAIVGNGNVGSALARGLKRAGHEVRAVGNDGATIRATAASAEVVILAVPFGVIDDVVKAAGDVFAGKTVVGFATSGAEELQKKLPSRAS